MLDSLRVKNFALIEEAEIEFDRGLNILTGETGAGKSILIDAVNIALGAKVPTGFIRNGAEFAYIELIFDITDTGKEKKLEKLDIFPEDGRIILTRKILPGKTISKINDETVTAAKLKAATALLIDIHGQHEHQSLLFKEKHLEILDAFGKKEILPLKQAVQDAYGEYQKARTKLASFTMEEETRRRAVDFCHYEIDEIEAAGLKEGEEEALTEEYKRFANAKKIVEGVMAIQDALSEDGRFSTGEAIAKAVREIGHIVTYDKDLESFQNQILDLESLLSDINRDLSAYAASLSFEDENFYRIEKRLDLIHTLQGKYGNTIEKINKYLAEKKAELEFLQDYEVNKKNAEQELRASEELLKTQSDILSELRKTYAVRLEKEIKTALLDLNFLEVQFAIAFSPLEHFTKLGLDEIEFMISTNPGQEPAPLAKVASGGELSRMMLAIKAVLADTDDIPTLIFDEIDTGISGRTAQKVSEKLNYIGKTHQVICITHLPQIAAMADNHFRIEKGVAGGKTTTRIDKLDKKEEIEELARLLGGAEITQSVRENAEEMKTLAAQSKKC